jgi:hypothetical protein
MRNENQETLLFDVFLWHKSEDKLADAKHAIFGT